MYILIMYSILFFSFVIYFSYCVKKFVSETKVNNAVILADKMYVFLLILTGFLYVAIFIATSVEDFNTIISTKTIPVAYSFIPLLIISYRVFLSEGLYAFNNNTLIGYNLKLNFQDLNIKQVKSTTFERVKVVAMFNNPQTKKQQKLILRLSKDNFYKLKSSI